jgi:glycosyltransferase involved in cell wall biosynthesis
MTGNNLEKLKIAIFSHALENTTGSDDAIYNFLSRHKATVVLIKFPFLKSKDGKITISKVTNTSVVNFYKPEFLSYAKDFGYALIYGARFAQGADFFIATDNLLALAGVLLKRVGVVKNVIYQIIDYSPVKYKSKLLNAVYYALDKFVIYHCSFVWPLNEEMFKARFKNPACMEKINWKAVPYGNDSYKYLNSDYVNPEFKKSNIAFFGTVTKNKGAELLILIAKELLKNNVENFKIISVGGGDYERLKKEIMSNGLDNYFEVHGPIKNTDDVGKILFTCGIALAPYFSADKNSFSYYADSGKIKDYLGFGLPILVTNVPPIAKKLQMEDAGLLVNYDAHDIAEKIAKLISNDSVYNNLRRNAIKLGKEFSWDTILTKAFEELI